jgi:hypothetical protein
MPLEQIVVDLIAELGNIGAQKSVGVRGSVYFVLRPDDLVDRVSPARSSQSQVEGATLRCAAVRQLVITIVATTTVDQIAASAAAQEVLFFGADKAVVAVRPAQVFASQEIVAWTADHM